MQNKPQVDDVLEHYGLSVTGPKALHAVSIAHPGFALYPLDLSQQPPGQAMGTVAALVPEDMFAEEDESSGSDSEEEESGDCSSLGEGSSSDRHGDWTTSGSDSDGEQQAERAMAQLSLQGLQQ